MADTLESDGIRLSPTNLSANNSVGNSDDSAAAQNQATGFSGKDFPDSHTQFTVESNSLSNCKLNSRSPLVGMNLLDNSVYSDSSKGCVVPSVESLSADHISDISHQTTDDLCSDRTSNHDPAAPVTNSLLVVPETVSESQMVQNCLSVGTEIRNDSSPEDCGDVSVKKCDSRFEDKEVKEWLQGTVEHLNRIVSSDENDLDVDLEMQDEETVEVQEFYEEEEIGEETVELEKETGCSKDEGEDENEEPLSYELQQGYKILRELMGNNNRSFTWPFVNPVEVTAEGCADYYEKVKKPMWLMKMKEKFERREYENITEYVADMRLMFENCYRYNGLNHPISRSGSKLEMMMEQKLQLLSRELREKTSLAATSGETFEMPLTSTRRQKQFSSGSMTVMHRLRYEAQEKEKEAKRQQQLDRKMAYEAMLKELDTWEDSLFKEPIQQQMKAMWELPQIGQFLFLCGKALNLAEVSQYELECCLLLPQQSSALQRIMTCFLSTPHQRARLQGKSLMPYGVWEEKLRQLLILWYRTYEDSEKDAKKTAIKLGLDEKFFKVVGRSNPLEKKKFHELTFYQRVWILKSLCDHCLEVQKSLNEVIESHPLHDQRGTKLGCDNDGNEYIHFPQFCGEDLRIYRQKRHVIEYQVTNKEAVLSAMSRFKRRHKHRHRSAIKKSLQEPPEPSASSATPRVRDSRLRQNPRQVQSYQVMDSSTSSESEDTSDDQEDDEEKSDEEKDEEEKEEEEKEANEQEEEEKKEKEMLIQEETLMEEEKQVETAKECDELAPKAVRSSRKRSGIDKNKTEVKSSEPESCYASYDSKHPRRSVRKILEESMKDAIQCTSPDTDKVPLRCSSVSSCSSVGLSRSGHESSCRSSLRSPEKHSSRSVGKGKRKKEFSSDECEVDTEPVCSAVTSPRLTRSRAKSRRSKLNDSVNRSKTCARQDSQLPLLGFGRITRNLYKSLFLEPKGDAANENCQQGQASEDTEKKGRKDSRRKKRSCLTVSNVSESRADCVSDCGDGQTNVGTAKVENSSKKTVCNGHDVVTHVRSCDGSVSSDVGQGDSNWKKNDPEVKMEFSEKMTAEATRIPSELASSDSNLEDEPAPLKSESVIASGDFLNNSVYGDISDSKTADLKSVESQKVENEVKNGVLALQNETESLQLETKEEVLQEGVDVKTDVEEKAANYPTNLESVAVEVKREEEDDVCEILGPEIGEFELVVESIQDLRQLIEKFADREDGSQQDKDASGNPRHRKRCTVLLHERLANLLEEVEKHEQHLLNFKKKKMIRLRKEQENFREEPEKEQNIILWPAREEMAENQATSDEGRLRRSLRQIGWREKAEDMWESNDSTSSNGNADATNDECSVDAESSSSKAEEKATEAQRKPRPSRKRTAVDAAPSGASPSVATNDLAPATPTSSTDAINIRKRTATSQGRGQIAKKAKKKNNCVENSQSTANSNSEVVATTPDTSSTGLSTPMTAKNALIRGLINGGAATAKSKQSLGAQPTSNLTSGISNQLSSTPMASYIFQQSNRIQPRPQRSMATSANPMTTRLVGSLPLAASNSSSFAFRRSAGSLSQASPRVNIGQVLQPYIEQGVLRLASPTGSGMQFLAVSNISQLPPGLLQQLLSNQGLRMVTSSVASQGHSAVATNTMAPSAAMSDCLFVPNNGLRPAIGITPDIHLSNIAQPRAISSQTLPGVVVQNPVCLANQNKLPSLPQAARTTLSTGSGCALSSQLNRFSLLTTSGKVGSPPTKPVQGLSSASASSSVHPLFAPTVQASAVRPLFRQTGLSNLPGVDSALRQRFTNNLTVRDLLGNRNSSDQIHHLYPSSGNQGIIATSLSNVGVLAVSAENVAANPLAGSLMASHQIIDIPAKSTISEYGCTNTQATSTFSIVVTSIVGSNQCHNLPVPGNQPHVLHSPDLLSSSLCFKVANVSSSTQRMEPSMSQPGNLVCALPTNNITVTGSKQLQQSMQALQVLAQTGTGSKIIMLPQDGVVSRTSGIRQMLAPDHARQTVFLSAEQLAAIAHVNKAKGVITTSISTSLPFADIKILTSSAASHTSGLGTHTTTVLKSPIPYLPPLTDNNRLSHAKPIIRSPAALLSAMPSAKALSVIPLHLPQASNVLPVSVQRTSSALPLPASVPTASSASTEARANVPIVFNSAIMMRGTQNVLVLQQTPVQVLSLDGNAPAINNMPLKISLNIPQSFPSSVCTVAHASQVLSHCKNSQASSLSAGSSNQLPVGQHQPAPYSSLPGLAVPNQVVLTPAAQHALSTHESVKFVLSAEQSAVIKPTQPHSIQYQLLQLPSAANQPSSQPAVAPSAASSNLQILAAQAGSSRPVLPMQKHGIVFQQNSDGARLGQLPLQDVATRVNNRFSARLITVSPPRACLSNAGGNDPQVLVSQLTNSNEESQDVRLLSNLCSVSLASGSMSQPAALAVMPTSVAVLERRPANVSQALGQAPWVAAVATCPSTQSFARQTTLPFKTNDGVRVISGTDAAQILQSRTPAFQKPQRRPILQVQTSTLNRPIMQLAVPTNTSTLPPLRKQVVQLAAVQPNVSVMQQGRVLEFQQQQSVNVSASQVVRINQQAQLPPQNQATQRSISAAAVHPLTQSSFAPKQPGFFLLDSGQVHCLTAATNYPSCSALNSSAPSSDPIVPSLIHSTCSSTVRSSMACYQPSIGTGMNLDLASLLQAASVVDGSANQGHDLNILNQDSMYDGQRTS